MRISRYLPALILFFLSVSIYANEDVKIEDLPKVEKVTVSKNEYGLYDFNVTISSPYDSPARYADAFRIINYSTGEVYAMRKLTHHHAKEQPFTRNISDVSIPDNIIIVEVQARDSTYGWHGYVMMQRLPE